MPWLQAPSNPAPRTLPESAAMLLSRAPQIVAAHVQNFKVHVDGGDSGRKKDGDGSGNNKDAGSNSKKVQVEVPATIADSESGKTYNRLRLLGRGGFAKCYELRDTSTNVLFAGKVIPKTRVAKPAQREKIDREVALHRTLIHRHVVAFHHSFEDEQNIYIILENCNRKCLANIIRHRKTLTEPEVRYYLRQVAEGVKYLHGLGIVHRDLKLGNFFLTENMDVKIGDFGLATNAAEEGEDRKRTICGTPNYIAPEVLQKKGHGYAADMWALGCAIYTMLAGRPPFETASLKTTYARILEGHYVMPTRLVTSSKALLRALLCKDPLQRLTLDGVTEHDFLTKEFVPTRLPHTACTVEPRFPTKPVTPKLATTQRCNAFNKKTKTPSSTVTTTTTPRPAAKDKEATPKVEKTERDGTRLNRVAAAFSNMSVTPSRGRTASNDADDDVKEPQNADDGEQSPTVTTPKSDAGVDVKRAIQSAVATFAVPASPRPFDSSTTVTAGAAVGSRCDRWATRKMLQALATCVDNMPTGISQDFYRRLVREEVSLGEWLCSVCRATGEVAQDEEETMDLSLGDGLPGGSGAEEEMEAPEDEAEVPREPTSPIPMPRVVLEDSIGDLSVEEDLPVGAERDVTFSLVKKGTKRGADKLTDSLGFAYTVRKRKVTVTYWECEKRPKEEVFCGFRDNQRPPQWSGPRGKVTWVPKWVDYSNRYGFGYQLSDNSVGLLMNDASLITLCPDKRTMQYYPAQSGGRTAIFTAATAPAHLTTALTLLDYFTRYMEDRLINGGDMPHSSVVSRDFNVERVPYVTRWFRTDRAIVMLLSCNTLQINFMEDHVKVILTCSDPEDYVMTYINQQRMSSTYRLVTLAHSGCPAEMRERMTYARAMLRKVVNMERLL
ncbi:serine/threonine-protein kinase PLK2-like [Branchiostoma floridae]|uniref:Serine/threonine-protein kinase PLK n=2 Tax=Branchiostoma floridae TaxID=7739 RepID=A0A9J7N8P8_BRAFL|nr:serine/threonine-protein kinase PLK2-like [Branchiostoma floridae]